MLFIVYPYNIIQSLRRVGLWFIKFGFKHIKYTIVYNAVVLQVNIYGTRDIFLSSVICLHDYTFMCCDYSWLDPFQISTNAVPILMCDTWNIPDGKVHGANMGPPWGPSGSCRPQVNFAIWDSMAMLSCIVWGNPFSAIRSTRLKTVHCRCTTTHG